jgi:small subunit ribosomal protein S6
MAVNRSYYYEGMFLIGQAAAADLAGVIEHIREILARGQAEIVAMKKWDERRLAYEIKKQKRGLYILVYFKAPGGSLAHIERDCNLSEKLLRVLLLRTDHLTEDEMKAADGREALETEARMRASQVREQPPAPTAEPVGAGTAAGTPAES